MRRPDHLQDSASGAPVSHHTLTQYNTQSDVTLSHTSYRASRWENGDRSSKTLQKHCAIGDRLSACVAKLPNLIIRKSYKALFQQPESSSNEAES